ncbi:MAG: NUDIX hydrolase [Rhodocyclaceae bacterium]|jgi:ADP-ribose pyrophosphatase|nr:NUDIX hydrolase [Rhodocyclaceae bacterium]MCO5096191.1 NUDIX hydrolase [Rhodocyclaceae bacterium]
MGDHKESSKDNHLRESIVAGEEVFSGGLLRVRRDTVRLPDGNQAVREFVCHPGAVVMIAELPNGKLLFERQFRYPLDSVFLELPAGKIHPGEDILLTARRELQEETGYVAEHWHHLGLIHPCIGYSDERIEIFFARGLSHVGHALDDGEFLEVHELDLAEALDAVRDGRLTDGKSVAALLWAERVLDGRWPLPEAG